MVYNCKSNSACFSYLILKKFNGLFSIVFLQPSRKRDGGGGGDHIRNIILGKKNVSLFVVDLISSADYKVKWHCNVFSTKQLIFYAFLTPESGAFQITQRQFIKGLFLRINETAALWLYRRVLIRSKDLSLELVNTPKT